MTNTKKPKYNISFYKIIFFLIITTFFSFRCYSVNSNDIQKEENLTSISLNPSKPPPSYKDVCSENNSILPTYKQALVMVADENTMLTEETNLNNSYDTINISNDTDNSTTQTNNCLCNYLKKHKKTILIRIAPYIAIVIFDVIIAVLTYKKITSRPTLILVSFFCIFAILIYRQFELSLIKRFIRVSE